MAVLLDSASLDDATAAAELGFERGITTNPALMAKETKEPPAHLARLLTTFPEGSICYQPTRTSCLAGSQDVSAPLAVIEALPTHSHTESAVREFAAHWER